MAQKVLPLIVGSSFGGWVVKSRSSEYWKGCGCGSGEALCSVTVRGSGIQELRIRYVDSYPGWRGSLVKSGVGNSNDFFNWNGAVCRVNSGVSRRIVKSRIWKSTRRELHGGKVGVDSPRQSSRQVIALWSFGKEKQKEQIDKQEEEEEEEDAEKTDGFRTIGDFTRFRDNGPDGAELQTAIIRYTKPFPWSLFDKRQVDLVAAVHIADKRYFSALQEELGSYDRVLYEMVADKNPRHTNRNVKYRWRPPKRRAGSSGVGFTLVGTIQKLMASILTLDFQLNCMDYRRENWYHADLDLETFQALQLERGETFFSFAKDVAELSSKTLMRNLDRGEHLGPWRSKLLWLSRVFPMPLVGLLVIEVVCAPSDSPLGRSPEVKALLEFDVPSALKVFLAKQITTDLTNGTSALVENSVIIGERNRVAMSELREALHDGCSKVAVFYGSGHLPDMDSRLRKEFGLQPTDIQWRTAWAIKRRENVPQGGFGDILGVLAQLSGWPLTRYQTLAIFVFSAALAVDLYFWELVFGAVNDYAQQTILLVVNILERGWGI